METPLVSISCITYNHAPFIRQCLDGFLMQQCNFPIEIIINDDCSTDGTTEIIREYAAKHPDKIFPIIHDENQWSKGVRFMSQKFVFPKARGKYIALCEGDDYWTDPLKLQKQVDFLESHPDYSMCFHKVKVWSHIENRFVNTFEHLLEKEYKAAEIMRRWSIPTCSAVYRRSIIDKIPTHRLFRYGDNVVFLTCSKYGRMYCMADCMSVYNVHAGGFAASHQLSTYLLLLFDHHRGLKLTFRGDKELDVAINNQIFSYGLSYFGRMKFQSPFKALQVLLLTFINGPYALIRFYLNGRKRWKK